MTPSERLRHACEAFHASTEQVLLLTRLATGDVSDTDYARVIVTFAALFEAVVVRIQAMPGGHELLALTDLATRARRARTDARSLDLPDIAHTLCVPFIQGSGSAVGAIYALEGARHGGTVIGAALRRAGRPVGTAGYSFFDLRGAPVAQEWRAFTLHLDRLLANEDMLEKAVFGARGVFALTTVAFGETLDG